MNEKIDTAGFNIGNIAGNGKAGNLLNVKGMKRGNWSYFFSPMVRFEENGQNFLFSHSADGNKIKLSSLTSEGEGQVFIDDKWHWYYNSQVPFVENGKNYIFCYSNRGNRWFISELSTKWNGQSGLRCGNWARYYPSVTAFVHLGKPIAYFHSEKDRRWFMWELSTDRKTDKDLNNGNLDSFYDTVTSCKENQACYILAQSSKTKEFFICPVL